MTADGCTYFGANVFTDARNLEIFETKTTVKGVSFVNGTNAKVVEAYDAQGNAYPRIRKQGDGDGIRIYDGAGVYARIGKIGKRIRQDGDGRP